jgi:hypothetical protein
MTTAKVSITVKDQQHPEAELIEAARILANLRHYTKVWQNEYGQAKVNKQKWEAIADQWLYDHVQQTLGE